MITQGRLAARRSDTIPSARGQPGGRNPPGCPWRCFVISGRVELKRVRGVPTYMKEVGGSWEPRLVGVCILVLCWGTQAGACRVGVRGASAGGLLARQRVMLAEVSLPI